VVDRPILKVVSPPAVAIGIAAALAVVLVLPLGADGPQRRSGWPMIGHDIQNTRSQPSETRISPKNVARLAPKWTLITHGDVSATPALGEDDDWEDSQGDRKRRGRHRPPDPRLAVYFPDWGNISPNGSARTPPVSTLWKVDAETGRVIWSNPIASYNGIANSISRTSPVLSHGLVVIGDLNGNMMGIDTDTGELVWMTELDPNPNTIVTTSPVVLGDRLYISTSSSGGGVARQIFRGSMIALDVRTGKILWRTFVLPDNGGMPGGFAGGAFVNPPAIDLENGLVIGAAGQLYFQPDSVTECLMAAPNGWSESCFPPGVYANSVVAFDLLTGEPRWSFRGAGFEAWEQACGDLPGDVTWCPPAATATAPPIQFSIWDFAGSGANVFQALVGRRFRNVIGIGQKSGVYWVLDARTGRLLRSTLVGPGSDPGGIQWGTAYDGRLIYAAIGHNTGEAYKLPSGDTITGGSWAAIGPWTGRIIWQTHDDSDDSPYLSALSVANGVLYGGSLHHTGNQMYALDGSTGEILWRFPAGGSVVAGPAIVGDTVYWGSGYARTGGVGNNKFYAFSVDGR
jgi:polyvinyl alcohol dehydrogenase (cytochrome)